MDLSDDALLRRAVTMATNHEHIDLPRWSIVRDIFGVGSGSGDKLCRRFGVDPDEILVGKPEICQRCGDGEFDVNGACPNCDLVDSEDTPHDP